MNDDNLMPPEAAIIKQVRAEAAAHGWSHRELARQANINWRTLYRYLALDGDDRRSMPLGVLVQLCDVLGISLTTLSERASQRSE